ncbi:hypothetical protein ACFX1S_044721 [Malus domestica]
MIIQKVISNANMVGNGEADYGVVIDTTAEEFDGSSSAEVVLCDIGECKFLLLEFPSVLFLSKSFVRKARNLYDSGAFPLEPPPRFLPAFRGRVSVCFMHV